MRGGDRSALARAITLVESTRPITGEQAQELLLELMPDAGSAMHVGITGVPGVGKSTTIEALGMYLIEQGHRVAVLAVDPSSTRTGGSILGDKTRMAKLAVHPDAYIRPSPTSGTLGGVAKATRETIVLLEAAGYDVILVETVGVGQSEVTVANMVDTFVFLTLARTGDQLQGIKKGVLELADIVVVNKADGEHAVEAKAAARELAGAIRLIYPRETLWRPPVLTMSALEGTGLAELWDTVLKHRRCSPRPGSSTPAGAPSRWSGPGRWSATPCWTGCCPIPGSRDPGRCRASGARRRADSGACCAADPRRRSSVASDLTDR